MGEGEEGNIGEEVKWVVGIGGVEMEVEAEDHGAGEVGEEITERWTDPGSLLVSDRRSLRPRFKPFLLSS